MPPANPHPIAIFISDIHLSHKPPLARALEPDWYEAMARPLREVDEAAANLNIPIICAGDLFDRWNSPAELINFALDVLPEMCAIPGQHDLPHHSYADMKRSAFWTMVKAKRVRLLDPTNTNWIRSTGFHAFPWGFPLKNRATRGVTKIKNELHIAVVHAYCWVGKHKYPGAPEEGHVSAFFHKGYDAMFFGDNHKGFINGQLCNCGGFMRRKVDEVDSIPCYNVLYSDGEIIRMPLDCSEDIILDQTKLDEEIEKVLDVSEFIEQLQDLGSGALDFRDAVSRFLRKNSVTDSVKERVLEAVDGN